MQRCQEAPQQKIFRSLLAERLLGLYRTQLRWNWSCRWLVSACIVSMPHLSTVVLMSISSSLFFFDGSNTILMLYKNNLLNFGCYMYKDGHLPHFHSRLSKHSKVHLALKLSDKVLTWPSHLLVQLMCVQEDSRCQKRKWNFVENQIWLCIVIEQK